MSVYREKLNQLRYNFNTLWIHKPNEKHEKLPLTDEGREMLKEICGLAIRGGLVPTCCINVNEAPYYDTNIISLSIAEYDDLISSLEALESVEAL